MTATTTAAATTATTASRWRPANIDAGGDTPKGDAGTKFGQPEVATKAVRPSCLIAMSLPQIRVTLNELGLDGSS